MNATSPRAWAWLLLDLLVVACSGPSLMVLPHTDAEAKDAIDSALTSRDAILMALKKESDPTRQEALRVLLDVYVALSNERQDYVTLIPPVTKHYTDPAQLYPRLTFPHIAVPSGSDGKEWLIPILLNEKALGSRRSESVENVLSFWLEEKGTVLGRDRLVVRLEDRVHLNSIKVDFPAGPVRSFDRLMDGHLALVFRVPLEDRLLRRTFNVRILPRPCCLDARPGFVSERDGLAQTLARGCWFQAKNVVLEGSPQQLAADAKSQHPA